jgi:hypothetical protein
VKSWLSHFLAILAAEQIEFAKFVAVPNLPFSVVGARLLAEIFSESKRFSNMIGLSPKMMSSNRETAADRYNVLVAGLDSYFATAHCTLRQMNCFLSPHL